MKAKEFFKTNAFKSIAVLMAIVIIAGALLAVFNDLLYVRIDPNQALADQIAASFGKAYEHSKNLVIPENKTQTGGEVLEAYSVNTDNGTQYLLKTKGEDAFGNGTVTVWVAVEVANNAVSGVGLVTFLETDVSKYYDTDSAFFNTFNNSDADVAAGKYFSTDASGITNVTSGATASSRAINNAVNASIRFVKAALGGASEEPTYTYVFEQYINMDKTTVQANIPAKEVAYRIVTKGNGEAGAFTVDVTVTDGVITAYQIVTNGSTSYEEHNFGDDMDASILNGSYFVGKTAAELQAVLNDKDKLTATILTNAGLSTGATRSTELCFRAAVFAVANADAFLVPVFDSYVKSYDSTQEGTALTFSITTKGNGEAESFVFEITVDNGVITAFVIKTNGSTSYEEHYFGDDMDASILNGSYFVGKTAAELQAVLNDKDKLTATILSGEGLSTGASRSTESCFRAAIFAAANYNSFLAAESETPEETPDPDGTNNSETPVDPDNTEGGQA